MPDLSFETRARSRGYWPCAGADEAGRGPLAGPVVAAAVILDPERIPAGIDDSKRLSARARSRLFDEILDQAVAVSVSSVCAESIDRGDIRRASLTAIAGALGGLAIVPRWAMVDGRDLPEGLPCPGEAIVGGDGLSLSIAAASVVAKTIRDRMMVRAASGLPVYGFEQHKGYGTAAHRSAIRKEGAVPRMHRFSFAPLRQKSLDLD
jgi:ribonuclease HII